MNLQKPNLLILEMSGMQLNNNYHKRKRTLFIRNVIRDTLIGAGIILLMVIIGLGSLAILI